MGSYSPMLTTIKAHLSIDHVCHVLSVAQKLHYFLAFAREFSPIRTGVRVLLQPAQLLAIDFEIDLT